MKTAIGLVFSLMMLGSMAQDGAPRVPVNFSLETPEDYSEHEALAKKCMGWLVSHSLDEFPEKRTELNAFALLWLSGTPAYKLEIQSGTIPCLKENDDLFPVFVYGMALYQMRHPSESDTVVLHAEGLRAVAKVGSLTRSIKRKKCMRRLRSVARKSRLKVYAAEQLRGN